MKLPTPEGLDDLLAVWPNCETADCEGKACLRLKSKYCHPCTLRLNATNSATLEHLNALFRERAKQIL